MTVPKDLKQDLLRAAEAYAKTCDIVPASGHAGSYCTRVEIHAYEDDASVTVRFYATNVLGQPVTGGVKDEPAIAALADRVGNIEAEYVNSEQFDELTAAVNDLLEDAKRADDQIQTNILVAQEALKRAKAAPSAARDMALEDIEEAVAESIDQDRPLDAEELRSINSALRVLGHGAVSDYAAYRERQWREYGRRYTEDAPNRRSPPPPVGEDEDRVRRTYAAYRAYRERQWRDQGRRYTVDLDAEFKRRVMDLVNFNPPDGSNFARDWDRIHAEVYGGMNTASESD